MPRRLLLLVAIAAFAVPALVMRAQQAAPPSTATGIVRGVVLREGTTEPIRDVQITVGIFSDMAQDLRTRAQEARQRGEDSVANLLESTFISTFGPNVRNATPQYGAITDINGRFTIDGIPPGEYQLNAQREGYFSTTRRPPEPFFRRTVTVASQKTTEVPLALIPGASVSGSVFDPNGTPAIGAQVEVFRRIYTNGTATFQMVARRPTDDRGNYRHFALPPDEYFLAAGATPAATGGRGRGTAETAPALGPPRTFYPGTTDSASAQPFRLRLADDLTGINLRMQSVIGTRISGRVISQLPAPSSIPPIAVNFVTQTNPIATLTLLPHDPAAFIDLRFVGGLQTSMGNASNGAFEITNVPPGTYDIYASLPDAAGYGPFGFPGEAQQPVAFGRTTVDVRGANLEGVVVAVHSGVNITGRVVVDGKPTNLSDTVTINLEPVDSAAGVNVYASVARFQPDIATDGSFTIPAVPEAKYRVVATVDTAFGAADVGGNPTAPSAATTAPARIFQAQQLAPRNTYIADIRQGGASIYDNGIAIGTSVQGPIEILINTNGGEIQGTVVRANQQPVPAGTTVVLVPAQSRRQNPALYKTATTINAAGAFRMRAVPPGLYKVFAWESVPASAYLNADFMKQYEERGVAISIGAGATASPTITLIPAQ